MRLVLLLAVCAVVAAAQSCTAPQQKCDFVCDCGDCEDEQDCGYSGPSFQCDFEDGWCGWTKQSLDRRYSWERRQRGAVFPKSGPSSDFTRGTATGWFVAVTEVRSEQEATAEMVSPTMKQTAPTCQLHLRYFLWDSGDTDLGHAPLWASVRHHDDEEEAVVWRPEPSSVRGWREATVFVGRVSSDFRLVFSSRRDQGNSGDVALDQLHFLHCALPARPECGEGSLICGSGACVEQRFVCDGTDDCGDGTDERDCADFKRCDFEDGLCDLWDLRSISDLKWIRTNQNNISTSDPRSGPGRDHSSNSATGHFLYVTVPETGLKMDWAAFQSKRLEPTTADQPCKMVFYSHQFGPRSGGLTVLVADTHIYPVWERGGALGDLWVRAEVDIVTNETFQIVIMAAIRDRDYGGVGVDSIVLSPGCQLSSGAWSPAAFPESPGNPCTVPERMCDFSVDCETAADEDMCGDFQFPRGHRGWTDSSVGAQGWQLYENSTTEERFLFVAEAAGRQKTKAQTRTPLLGPSGPVCTVGFDYALTGSSAHIGELSLQVVDSLLGPLPKLWQFAGKTGSEEESWRHTEVLVGLRKTRFQLAFEAGLSDFYDSQIRVKNVSFHECNRNYHPSSPTGLSCNFEEDLCEWFQDNSDNFDWTLLQGMDHTIGVGRSLVVDLWSSSLRGAFGRLLSYELMPSNSDMCLSFFYKLYGPNTGVLNVKLLDDRGFEQLLWSRTGAHGNQWHEAQCPVPPQLTRFRLALEAVRSGFDGRVAVDDVAFVAAPCSSVAGMCSFEGSSCGFSSSAEGPWRRTNSFMSPAAGPKNDHTLETQTGFFMVVNSSSNNLPSWSRSSLSSPVFPGTSRLQCLSLWYHMGQDKPGSLTVYVKPVKGERVEVFSSDVNQGEEWRHGQGNISSELQDWQLELELEVVGGGGKNTHVAVDDIYVSPQPCDSPGWRCSLENGLCSWSNTQDVLKDGLDWDLTSAETEDHYQVPDSDHTLGHERGHFLFLPSSERTAANQNAWLLSPHLPQTKGTCLSFWALMPHSDSGELKVWTRSDGKNTELLSTTDTGRTWRYFAVNITSKREYQIVLEGIKGASGFMALDDIEYDVGKDCNGKQKDNVFRGLDIGGTVSSAIVTALLIVTLLGLLVCHLKTRDTTPPAAAAESRTGFINEVYDPDLTDDHIQVPPAQDPSTAGLNPVSFPEACKASEDDVA